MKTQYKTIVEGYGGAFSISAAVRCSCNKTAPVDKSNQCWCTSRKTPACVPVSECASCDLNQAGKCTQDGSSIVYPGVAN
jgi:hypothetical protein